MEKLGTKHKTQWLMINPVKLLIYLLSDIITNIQLTQEKGIRSENRLVEKRVNQSSQNSQNQ